MNILLHFVVSVIGGALIYILTQSPDATLLAFIGAIFIDLDHLYEYHLYRRNYSSLKEFLDACLKIKLPKIYIFLHSWDFLILFTFVAYLFLPYFLPLLWGMSLHLFFDLLSNPLAAHSYFYFYRLKVKFSTSLLK